MRKSTSYALSFAVIIVATAIACAIHFTQSKANDSDIDRSSLLGVQTPTTTEMGGSRDATTANPSVEPSMRLNTQSTDTPSIAPTAVPTAAPTSTPSESPTSTPTTKAPTNQPTPVATSSPTATPYHPGDLKITRRE
eukprot:scaffold40950_cov199-Amphora_coffeaeformis.AAC.1